MSAAVAESRLGICPGCARPMAASGQATAEVALHAERGLCTRCVHSSAAQRALAELFYRPEASHWLPLAACTAPDVNPEWFYPHEWESPAEARAVCRQCPVARECLDDALQTKDAFGVRGGFTVAERAVIRRHRARGVGR